MCRLGRNLIQLFRRPGKAADPQRVIVVGRQRPATVPMAEIEPEWRPRWRLGRGGPRGGPNLPKFQTCPECHGSAKRVEKISWGATYNCRRHGIFIVKHPRLTIPISHSTDH